MPCFENKVRFKREKRAAHRLPIPLNTQSHSHTYEYHVLCIMGRVVLLSNERMR